MCESDIGDFTVRDTLVREFQGIKAFRRQLRFRHTLHVQNFNSRRFSRYTKRKFVEGVRRRDRDSARERRTGRAEEDERGRGEMLKQVGLQRLGRALRANKLLAPGVVAASSVFSSSFPTSNVVVARQSTMASGGSSSSSSDGEILSEERFATKIAIMNRPKKLNALSLPMVCDLRDLYERWEKDPYVHLVILKGSGRGFCAGGDVAGVYQLQKAGNMELAIEYFRKEYVLNYLIGTYKKPHVALLNGVVMGGGTGLSIHGTFRVATENSLFAMPETAIGLHPDVGASYYLSRLPGHLGEFLATTGTRLDGADMVATNLATHFVPSHRLAMLEERLGSLNTEDIAVVSNAIDEFCDIVHLSVKSPLHRRKEIDSCFGRSSMEEIVRAVEAGVESGNPWYQEVLTALKKVSPLSLKVTLRSVREGRRQQLYQCLQREFRLSAHAVESRYSSDFLEGCRALLVDKDNSPKWNPPSLEQVTAELVDYHFSPLGDLGEELVLPVAEREPRAASYSRL